MADRFHDPTLSAKLMNSFMLFYITGRRENHGELQLMMRKLSYFGLIVMLLGIVCVVVAEANLQNVKSIDVGDNKSPGSTWYYACNLTSGNTYWVYIESNAAWGEAFQSGAVNDSAQPVDVTITSPGGGVTSLQAFFYSISSSSPEYREGTPPAIVEVTYENVDSSSLSVNMNSPSILFSVEKSGTYNVSVLNEGWIINAPPDFFVFYEEVSPNGGTYTLLASGGGVLGIIGGVTVVVSIFRKGRARHKSTSK